MDLWEAESRRESKLTKQESVAFVPLPNSPCPKCGSKMRLALGQRQQRAVDEAATEYYMCDNPKCGVTKY